MRDSFFVFLVIVEKIVCTCIFIRISLAYSKIYSDWLDVLLPVVFGRLLFFRRTYIQL